MLKIGLFVVFATIFSAQEAISGGYKDKSLQRPIPVERQFYNHVPAPVVQAKNMPEEFNWCSNNGTNYCTASWNQHIPVYCGSCWAHASLSMIQDRLKIKKGGKGIDVLLSRQTLLNCAAQHGWGHGCDGGDTIDAFRYMKEFGLPDDTCQIYSASDHTKFDSKYCPASAVCSNCCPVDGKEMCWPVKTPIKYYVTAYGKLAPGPEAMQQEILARGPIVCGAACPDDFVFKYPGGIYTDPDNDHDLDHDVEVVGWGEEDGQKYWLIRNSWGAYWGQLGFFKLLRGNNTFNIEGGDCWYAEVENSIELAVESGELVGSMYGLVKGVEPTAHPRDASLEAGDESSTWASKVLLLPLRETGESLLTRGMEGSVVVGEGSGDRANGGVARRLGEQV
ncbi:MAG: hypothetical protein WDW36_001534 [Sanguina aurantia]